MGNTWLCKKNDLNHLSFTSRLYLTCYWRWITFSRSQKGHKKLTFVPPTWCHSSWHVVTLRNATVSSDSVWDLSHEMHCGVFFHSDSSCTGAGTWQPIHLTEKQGEMVLETYIFKQNEKWCQWLFDMECLNAEWSQTGRKKRGLCSGRPSQQADETELWWQTDRTCVEWVNRGRDLSHSLMQQRRSSIWFLFI